MDEILVNAYKSGVTANICDALLKLKPESTDAEIETTIRYASSLSQKVNDIEVVNIRGNHFYVIDEISKRYRDRDKNQQAVIKGIIKSLNRNIIDEVHQERNISVISLIDGQYRVIKGELDEESYRKACDAFRDEYEIEISGILDMSSKNWSMKHIDNFKVITKNN